MATYAQHYRPQPPPMTTQTRDLESQYARDGYEYGYSVHPPPQNGQMTLYQPPQPPAQAPGYQTVTQPTQQRYYQQNTAAFEPVRRPERSIRRPSTPDIERKPSSDPRRDRSEPPPKREQREGKTVTSGGPLAGAAGGALLGANLAGRKGHAGAGAVAGTVIGGFAGTKLERRFKDQRQQKANREQEILDRQNDHADRIQNEQDRYDEEYSAVANAAPGYGSSLLPSDTSHGGKVNRNSRSGS